jgi:hypothetical protein
VYDPVLCANAADSIRTSEPTISADAHTKTVHSAWRRMPLAYVCF